MEKINSLSYSTLVISLSGSVFFGILSSYMFNNSMNSLLISLILGFLLSLLFSKLYLSFFNKMPELNISEKFQKIYGKASIIFNIIFIIISFSVLILLSYRLTSFLSSQYLTNTSELAVLLLFYITVYNIASKGIETITRVSIISFFLALFIYLFDVLSLVSFANLDNLMPIIINDKMDFIKNTLIFSVYFSVPTFYVNSIRKNQIRDKDNFNKYFYLAYAFSFITILIYIIITLSIFGYKLTTLFDYSLYTVLKRITVFSYIHSVENISVGLWLLYIINASNVYFYATVSAIKDTFKLKNNKYISIALLVIGLLIPRIFFIDNNFFETFEYAKIPLGLFSILLFIIFISNIIAKKRCKTTS